ncbi:hypothetical protein GE09DRAFT_1106350 [Coniochaeta sp. 2T2.1]|nr:hypothetical protein GE09DRAFT_1106350 [Coniochaeta sp. 2T2.1]
MKIQLLILATSTVCSAAVARAPPAKQTFELIPFEKVKADAERLGVFKPEPDHRTFRNNTNKAAGDVDSDFDAAAGTCVEPAIRVEWRDLSEDDRNAWINAVKCLMGQPSSGAYPGSQNRHEDFVYVHQAMTGQIHMVGQFLPWHRYYLHIYEQALKEECGYAPAAMPWWDESKDSADFTASPLFIPQAFGPIPKKGPNGEETCLTSGFAITIHIGPGGGLSDRCLARALDDTLVASCNDDFSNYCNSYTTYAEMEPCAERGPHAYCHNGIGGAMADVASSPGDPIFFMHHSYVDRQWRLWQNGDPARLSEVGGNTAGDGSGPPLTLDYVLTSMGLREDATVADVMDIQGGYLCYQYSY